MHGMTLSIAARLMLGATLWRSSPSGNDSAAPLSLVDFARFVACFTGPEGPSIGPECAAADLDVDGDVDLIDFQRLQRLASHAGGASDEPLFGNPEYRVGEEPRSVACADLDADGDADLSVPNHADGTVSVLLNRGNAVFDEERYTVGLRPIWTSIGDMDLDGSLDVVSVNEGISSQGRPSVSLLPAVGDGTFEFHKRIRAGGSPRHCALADMDDDGQLDIVVLNVSPPATVRIIKNLGNFEFTRPMRQYREEGSFFVRTADLNGDDIPEWVVARWSANTVTVVHHTGLATPPVTVDYAVGVAPRTVAIGDINGDGFPDLAVGNQGDFVQGIAGSVSVLLNDGAGDFGQRVDYSAGVGPWFVAIEDLDADEDADLTVVNVNGQDVSVLKNLGDGTFSTETRYTAGGGPRAVTVADMNGDGAPDLSISNTITDNVSVLMNRGDGTFLSDNVNPVGVVPWTVVVDDVNGDEKDDLVTANFASGDLSVLIGNGNGSFGRETGMVSGPGVLSVATGDFDEDGDVDLASVNFFGNNVSLFRNLGDGSFQSAGSLPGEVGPWSVHVADLDNDDHLDLAVSNSGDLFPPGNTISVYRGRGDGTFDPHVTHEVGEAPCSIAIGDIDGDTDLDVAVANFIGNTVSLLFNDAAGGFAPAIDLPVGDAPTFVVMGDLNGDGDADLAVSTVGSPNKPARIVAVLLNDGNRGFSPAVGFEAGLRPSALAIGDVNDDGRVDIVTANTDDENSSILLGNGDGTFAEIAIFGTGRTPSSVLAVDFDHDGDLDIATANNGGDNVSVLLNRLFEPDP